MGEGDKREEKRIAEKSAENIVCVNNEIENKKEEGEERGAFEYRVVIESCGSHGGRE